MIIDRVFLKFKNSSREKNTIKKKPFMTEFPLNILRASSIILILLFKKREI